ncbi:DUF4230 domain-containing protein [Peribacillus asahii]|uniref:DUF4230 domain-containing protein n=1 Tax=Peribacillus asahii TaxID=228899 RepID=UPI00207A84F8|nr:DUF4230 domain-containing protein [Peribacillus asahii]USK70297.1 DUF4230 domain-containing protein [Peribacillus asahii]
MDTNREIIKEKDEKIAQLERLLVELTASQQQSAATIAVDYNSRSLSTPKRGFKYFLKASGLKIILVILAFLVIAAGGIWLFSDNPFKQESVTFVEEVKELSTLATAEARMKTVLQEEDNKILGKDIPFNLDLPGTKRQILLIVPATVIAGVDLKGITSKDMIINEETKEIDITLPHAELIQEPSVQMDKIQTFVDGGLFRDDVKWDEGFDLADKAQEQISQEAISEGLLTTAEKNVEKVLKEFFKNIGYTINVTFN